MVIRRPPPNTHRRRVAQRGLALLEVIVFAAALLTFWHALGTLSGWWRTAGEARFVVGDRLLAAARGAPLPVEVALADGTPMRLSTTRSAAPANLMAELEAIGVRYGGRVPVPALLPSAFVRGSGGWLTVRGELPDGVYGGGPVSLSGTIEQIPSRGAARYDDEAAWRAAIETDLLDRWRPFDFR